MVEPYEITDIELFLYIQKCTFYGPAYCLKFPTPEPVHSRMTLSSVSHWVRTGQWLTLKPWFESLILAPWLGSPWVNYLTYFLIYGFIFSSSKWE